MPHDVHLKIKIIKQLKSIFETINLFKKIQDYTNKLSSFSCEYYR